MAWSSAHTGNTPTLEIPDRRFARFVAATPAGVFVLCVRPPVVSAARKRRTGHEKNGAKHQRAMNDHANESYPACVCHRTLAMDLTLARIAEGVPGADAAARPAFLFVRAGKV